MSETLFFTRSCQGGCLSLYLTKSWVDLLLIIPRVKLFNINFCLTFCASFHHYVIYKFAFV